MISENQGNLLLRLARQTIEKEVAGKSSIKIDEKTLNSAPYQEKRGVFVTLKKNEMLRGCIGCLTGEESLVNGIRHQAANAALNDYRFPALSADELNDIRINISILTEPELLEYTDSADLISKLRPGVDGVILRDQYGRGATFLPQVWEQLGSVDIFLSHLCRKAGLQDNAWRSGKLEIKTYQVQYFEEDR